MITLRKATTGYQLSVPTQRPETSTGKPTKQQRKKRDRRVVNALRWAAERVEQGEYQEGGQLGSEEGGLVEVLVLRP